MATMYSIFLRVLLTAVCSVNGNCVLKRFYAPKSPAHGDSFLLDQKEGKSQGLVARLNCLLISGNKTNSLRSDKSDCLSEIIDNSLRLAQPRPFYWDSANITPLESGLMSPVKLLTIALGGTNVWSESSSDEFWTLLRPKVSGLSGMEDKENLITTIATTPLQSRLMSPLKQFFYDDLLAYGIKGRKATNCNSEHFAFGQESQSKEGIRGNATLGPACVALRSRDEHRVNSLDLCGTFYQGKVPRQSANEDRNNIIKIASAELGIKEATGNNDGHRVEQYLRYTNLGPGHDWCAAFVSWVYSQAGFSRPRNPWSPALFPKARSYKDAEQIQRADLFSIYSSKLKRIHHVGLIKEKQGKYILTIEGNSNDRVESRRRHQRTVYSYADWVD